MRISKIIVPLTALVLLLSACDTSGLETDDPTASESAPLTENVDRYIVVMKADAAAGKTARQLVDDYATLDGVQADYRYYNSIQGFAGEITPARLEQLRNDPNVAYIEKDQLVTIDAQAVPTGIRRAFANGNSNLGIDGTDDFRVDVDIAIIDTGIDREHPDLNVVGGVNCAKGGPFGGNCSTDGGGDDDHYHGTHVAGSAAAIDNGFGVVGVAPGARLWAVKVLNKRGSGYTSWIIGGIDWVADNADVIEVANMSLGGSGFSQAEYDAIQAAVNAGVAFVVAAGNNDDDAENYSPAAFDNTLTVSALADFDGEAGGLGTSTCRNDQDDTLADFSNWGDAVDIAAPGVCIYSTVPAEYGDYGILSGTSMASPHVAGAVALLASVDDPETYDDVKALYTAVINAGNFDWMDDSGDMNHEPLLDVNDETVFSPAMVAGGGGTTDNPPTVSITSPANNASFDSGASIDFAGSALDDDDGDISSNLSWTSNLDGPIGSGASFSDVLSDGTHTITASVTDSGNNTSDNSITITVGGSEGGITLSVVGYKVRGKKHGDLTWSDASSTDVDIYRDGNVVATTANDGAYTDNTGQNGGGSTTWKVCEPGTGTCSNSVTVDW